MPRNETTDDTLLKAGMLTGRIMQFKDGELEALLDLEGFDYKVMIEEIIKFRNSMNALLRPAIEAIDAQEKAAG